MTEDRRNPEEPLGVVLAQANGQPISITNFLNVRSLGLTSTAFGISNLPSIHRLPVNEADRVLQMQVHPGRRQRPPQAHDSAIESSADAVEMDVDDYDRITFAEGSPHITLSRDRMSAWAKSEHVDKIASVSATLRWNRQLDVAYYEVTIGRRDSAAGSSFISAPKGSGIVIGIAANKPSHDRQVGCTASSFGYKGSSGQLFAGTDHAGDFGPQFRAGDTIGCGIAYESGHVFFTRNGAFLREAGSFVGSMGVYPCVSIPLDGEDMVTANFGRDAFKFDVASYVAELVESKRKIIASMPVESLIAHDLVKEYLRYSGYSSVVSAMEGHANNMDQASMAGCVEPHVGSGVRMREIVRRHVTKGEIVEAMKVISDKWPAKMANPSTEEEKMVWMELHYQRYIELINDDNILEALKYLRTTLREVAPPSTDTALLFKREDAHGLLAYKDPFGSPCGHLLSQERRQKVAHITNRLLLSFEREASNEELKHDGGRYSNMERVIRHLSQTLTVRHDHVNKGSGRQFDIAQQLQGGDQRA